MKTQSETINDRIQADHVNPDEVLQEKERGVKAEIGGPKGLEPTRYGDWEKNGRCIDF